MATDPHQGAPDAGPPSPTGRRRPLLDATRRWYRTSVPRMLFSRLRGVSFVSTVTLLGATFLLSALPLVVLLGAFAGRRTEDGLTQHMGLDHQAAAIVDHLFENPPTNSIPAVVLAAVFSFAGAIGMAGLLQQAYEQVFGKARHGRYQVPRLMVWVASLCGWLALDAFIGAAARGADWEPLVVGTAVFVASGGFFLWSMLLLLGRRSSWRPLVLPAVVSALLWLGLQGFASLYFSSTIVTDSRLYGPVGVVFGLLVWFTAFGAVVVLGALTGDVWRQHRRAH